MAFGMGASFNPPKSNDPTSALPISVPSSSPGVQPITNPISALLGKKKKGPRAPQALASAIAKSKSSRQGKMKYSG
jgi:hypothetical protein